MQKTCSELELELAKALLKQEEVSSSLVREKELHKEALCEVFHPFICMSLGHATFYVSVFTYL